MKEQRTRKETITLDLEKGVGSEQPKQAIEFDENAKRISSGRISVRSGKVRRDSNVISLVGNDPYPNSQNFEASFTNPSLHEYVNPLQKTS